MIEEWLTERKKEEIALMKKNIIVAEMTEGPDGVPAVIGCTIGNEAILSLLIATVIERMAETIGITYPEAEERVRIAHTWSASQKAISKVVNDFEGGNKK